LFIASKKRRKKIKEEREKIRGDSTAKGFEARNQVSK